ncbi:Hypothetical_protein [Hexamita inflata]|uniref:Hypothetical_protein n=1 Tax=Hexamita inflata TaxID=28002 RepID=A0AA86U3T1_9EUKA|nr:Hypothetical protein HINF_LOCUS28890 [Hexamita inflata]
MKSKENKLDKIMQLSQLKLKIDANLYDTQKMYDEQEQQIDELCDMINSFNKTTPQEQVKVDSSAQQSAQQNKVTPTVPQLAQKQLDHMYATPKANKSVVNQSPRELNVQDLSLNAQLSILNEINQNQKRLNPASIVKPHQVLLQDVLDHYSAPKAPEVVAETVNNVSVSVQTESYSALVLLQQQNAQLKQELQRVNAQHALEINAKDAELLEANQLLSVLEDQIMSLKQSVDDFQFQQKMSISSIQLDEENVELNLVLEFLGESWTCLRPIDEGLQAAYEAAVYDLKQITHSVSKQLYNKIRLLNACLQDMDPQLFRHQILFELDVLGQAARHSESLQLNADLNVQYNALSNRVEIIESQKTDSEKNNQLLIKELNRQKYLLLNCQNENSVLFNRLKDIQSQNEDLMESINSPSIEKQSVRNLQKSIVSSKLQMVRQEIQKQREMKAAEE